MAKGVIKNWTGRIDFLELFFLWLLLLISTIHVWIPISLLFLFMSIGFAHPLHTHGAGGARLFPFSFTVRIIDKFASNGRSTSFLTENSLEPFQTALKNHFKFIVPNLTLIPTCVQTTELILGRWHIANRLIIFLFFCSFNSIRNSREPYFTKRTKAKTSDFLFTLIIWSRNSVDFFCWLTFVGYNPIYCICIW